MPDTIEKTSRSPDLAPLERHLLNDYQREFPLTLRPFQEIAQQQGRFTIFALVDALTRISGQVQFAGDRTEVDQKAGSLLALAV